jgi:hypothetical protein
LAVIAMIIHIKIQGGMLMLDCRVVLSTQLNILGFGKTTIPLTTDPFERGPMRAQNPSKIRKKSSGLGAQTIMHTDIIPGESPSTQNHPRAKLKLHTWLMRSGA